MNECEADRILRKINSVGLAGLSSDELKTLRDASRFYASGGSGAFVREEEAVDAEVSREEAARTHVEAVARGIPGVRVIELWTKTGFVFGARQPLRSEIRRFKELIDSVTCDRCDRSAPRFFLTGKGMNDIVCGECRD